ncbi:MAG: VCBS repeat-containing protein, partial [Bacteroidales bacterium]|nr:VCBS repeat-containing protein [Candidatus Latescibacterota bacterium]
YENIGGTFSFTPIWSSAPENYTYSVALGDVDGDGDPDLVCGNSGESNTLYENTGGTFSSTPIWFSAPVGWTRSIILGDVDGDGDLDLVCGNNGNNTLYENIGGTFSITPIWSSGPTNGTRSIALGDVDGDGDLDLVCGNYGESNTIYENSGGMFSSTPMWLSDPTNGTSSVALGDIGGDGDLDLVCGNSLNNDTYYSNIKNPAYTGDLLVPTNQVPNNGPFIGRSSVDVLDENHYRVIFTVYDVESDVVWVVPEYQFAGEPQWWPVYIAGGTSFGPIATAPEGVTDSLEWDISLVPFDYRDVVLRLRVAEIPVRVSTIQHASSYLQTVGRIIPIRPELSSSTDSLLFSQTAITVGDTASLELILSNTGTVDLLVSQIELPSSEMRITGTTPITLHPGEADTVAVFIEPRIETDISDFITIASDDPVTPYLPIMVTTDIRSLDVTHELLKASDVIPLGEAVTVVVTPAPQVNVELGHITFRAAGTSAFLDSISLSTFKDEFVVVIPGEKVTEADLEYYIIVENSGVFGTDPSGAPDSFYTQAVESPTGITTEPAPNSGADYLAGREIKVHAIIPTGTDFHSGSLYYREGGSDSYLVESLFLEGVYPEASIPGSMVGARGVEYWVDVETETAHLSDPPAAPSLYPRAISVMVQDLVEPSVHAGGEGASAYRMMSIPLQFKEDFTGTIEALLSDQPEFGPYDPVKWRSWAYLPESGTYGELSDQSFAQSFRPEPGRAFWLISRADHRISTAPVSGLSTPTGTLFALELASGWNMIGSPFAFPVSWDSVRVDTLYMSEAVGVSVDPPIGWDSGYSNEVSTMEPFDGYWIYNRADDPVTLYIPDEEAEVGVSHSPLAVAASGEDFRVFLHVTSGDHEDFSTFIGTSTQAVRDLDRLDRMKPPPAPGQGISLYLVTRGAGERCYRLSADIRSNPASGNEWGEVWAFDVMKSVSDNTAGDAVTITVNSIKNLPADADIVLVDRTLDRQIALGEDVEYTFYLDSRDYVATEEETRFRIVLGSESFVQEEAARLSEMPGQAALYQNYPNPFNPSTIIRYDIAESGMVSLRIYNVTGALVKVLEARHRDRGRYEVGWNGENNRGEQISSGIYFYRLTAPGYSRTRKMVLIR